MEQRKVFIAVATYNNGRYIRELLTSLIFQTYTNIEIIIRDDGSSDNTKTIVKEMADSDSRIKIMNIENEIRGAKTNFFTLLLNIPLNEDEYLMFCDADDVWKKDKVEKTLKAMLDAEEKYGVDTPILVHTDLEVVNVGLNTIASSLFRYEKLSYERDSLKEILVQNNVTGCTVMINRNLKGMIVEIPKDAVMHDWWLALIASAFGEIICINDQTILYRQHENNQIGAYNSKNPLMGIKKLSNKARMKEIYLSMFRQAGCFSKTYGHLLTDIDKSIVDKYAKMEHLSKMKRILRIIKEGYYKNTFMRNVGQFFLI